MQSFIYSLLFSLIASTCCYVYAERYTNMSFCNIYVCNGMKNNHWDGSKKNCIGQYIKMDVGQTWHFNAKNYLTMKNGGRCYWCSYSGALCTNARSGACVVDASTTGINFTSFFTQTCAHHN